MKNYRRLLALALFLAAAGILGSVLLRGRDARSDLPRREIARRERSVVLVTLDTTRPDRLEPYGATDVETPNLKRLADQGIVFEAAYAVAPITLVSHTSLLTGLYPPQHGVRNNGTHYVPDELSTLAERFQAEGYRTAAFVSAAVLERRYGLTQGFEVYDDDLSSGRERHPRMVPDRPAQATVDAALAWLDTLAETERFFLWVHFYDPHAAYSPPPPFRDRYRERLYDGEIAYMDSQIGRLLEHPLLSAQADAVVAVVADHGESLGEHKEQTHGILAYDSTLHVPFLLRIPRGPAGLRVKAEVAHVDVVPTLLDLVGAETPEKIAGTSLLPMLEGRAGLPERAIYSEAFLPFYTYGWAQLKVLRRGSWKYVEAPTPELFDLHRDPRELSNQAEQLTGRAHDLKRDLEQFLATESATPEATLSLDTEAAERLRSLGYLSVGSGRQTAEAERPDPKDVIDLHTGLERARQLVQDRLFEPAIRQLREVLARDPNNLAALIDLASALERHGEVEEAIQVAERALQIDPQYSRLYLLMAGLENRRGHPEQALELVRTVLGLDAKFLEARLQEIYLLRQLRRLPEAQEKARAVRADHPENPQAMLTFAQVVEMPERQHEAAEATLRQAVARDPFLIGGWRTLGQLLEGLERSEEARAAYVEGLEREPDDAELHALLGLLLARRGAQDASQHLREAIRLNDDFRPDLHVALGGWLAEQGRFEEAQKEYERVLEVEPRHPGARNNRAIAYYYTGRLAEARQELEQLVAEFPKLADAHNNLAAVAVDQQEWALAEQQARLTLELQPRSPQALNNLGIALEEQKRLASAIEAYGKALEIEPLYWQARLNLGLALRHKGEARAAAEAFEKVLEQLPSHAEAHYELGQLYAGPLADTERARNHYNAFLRYAPRHALAPDVRARLVDLPGK